MSKHKIMVQLEDNEGFIVDDSKRPALDIIRDTMYDLFQGKEITRISKGGIDYEMEWLSDTGHTIKATGYRTEVYK